MNKVAQNFYAGLLFLVIVSPTPVCAYVFNVNVDTSSLAGTNANLAFDFIDGDVTINNTVQVDNFLTDGSLGPGSASLKGNASGSLNSTVILGDSDFFNEFLQPITLGNSFQFQLETTNAFAGGIPDSFSFFILDSARLPLFATTDASGTDALFALDLTGTGSGDLSVFASTSTQPDPPTWSIVPLQTVPEPGSLGLLMISGLSVYRLKKRKNRT